MKIISKVPSTINPKFILERLHSTLYPIENKVLNYIKSQINFSEKNLGLFSGGFRLDLPITYVEMKGFAKADVKWGEDTLFLNPDNKSMIEYILKKISPDTILILNSNVIVRYQHWKEIHNIISYFKKFSKKIMLSIPIDRFDFNRLKYTESDIASLMSGIIIENTLIVCR